MKYEFHVGDYVETVAGFIGWVSNVDRNYITIKSNEGTISGPWSIPEEQYHFNRIGQYDFTKKEEGKIEPLACETASDYSNEKLRKKINEIVDAVNELRMRDAKESKDD